MRNKKFFLLIGDIIVVYLAFLSLFPYRIFLFHSFPLYLFLIFLLFLLGFYEINFRKITDLFKDLLIFLFLAEILIILYSYFDSLVSKSLLILNILIFSFLLFLWRYFSNYIFKIKKEKVVLIGSESEFKNLSSIAKQNNYEIVEFFDHNLPLDISQFKEVVEKKNVSLVVFSLNPYKNGELLKKTFPLKLNFLSLPDFYESITKKIPLELIDKDYLLKKIKEEKLIEKMLKRGFDIFFSFIGLLITGILFPFIALVIKIDSSGPIIYTQKRVGKNGKIFTIYKFRTMKKDAEKDGPKWAIPNDPRITRVGKFLRATYLDEFPQFYNILKGDISFVGPRPERPVFVDKLKKEIPYYEIRHLIKPGLTGWAQINFPASSSVEEAKEKFKYELYYIKNRSFLLDLAIILRTIKVTIFKI